MKYAPEVMEIHNEFNTAGETLLKKAEEILSKTVTENAEKVAKLRQYGFNLSKDVNAVKESEKEKEHQRKLIEAISYYKIKFPNYKFIPQSHVKIICEKHGLVSGKASQYKGFVPEKNLNDIEKFFTTHEDMRYTYTRTGKAGDGIIAWAMGEVKITKEEYDELTSVKNEVILPETIKPITGIQSFGKGHKDTPIQKSNPISDYWLGGLDPYRGVDNSDGAFGYAFLKPRNSGRNVFYDELLKYSSFYGNSGLAKQPTAFKKETELHICAPMVDMNTNGYELREGYKLVYDPIVSVEVTHKNGIIGEIILTAWGDEASDELVINQQSN